LVECGMSTSGTSAYHPTNRCCAVLCCPNPSHSCVCSVVWCGVVCGRVVVVAEPYENVGAAAASADTDDNGDMEVEAQAPDKAALIEAVRYRQPSSTYHIQYTHRIALNKRLWCQSIPSSAVHWIPDPTHARTHAHTRTHRRCPRCRGGRGWIIAGRRDRTYRNRNGNITRRPCNHEQHHMQEQLE
jgi:hypothetical protein